MDDSSIVVLNPPSGVSEDEFALHFQKKKNGGGYVCEVKLEKGVAFVVFVSLADAVKVVNHPEKQIMKGCELDVRSYSSWLKTTQDDENSASGNNDDVDSVPTKDDEDKATIYVSGLKESTNDETIALFFENKRRTSGGDLRDGKEGFERLSPTVARLTYVSSKDAENVMKRAKEKLLVLNGCPVQVTADYIPSEDRSILMVTNLSPYTDLETFKNFVEEKKNTIVFKMVFGNHGKAVIILEEEIKDEDDFKEKISSKNFIFGGRSVSLKFAPLTKGIKVKKIPKNTTKDDVKDKFSNTWIGGGEVINMEFDQNNGIAKLFFKSSSVVSTLVKKDHVMRKTLLTVLPLYDDFEELDEHQNKITEYNGDIHCESDVFYHILLHHDVSQFNLKSVKYDQIKSTFNFTKFIEDPKDGDHLSRRLKTFVDSFGKETLAIPTVVFDKVKHEVLGKRDESEIEVRFEKSSVVLVGRRKDITRKKRVIKRLINELTVVETVINGIKKFFDGEMDEIRKTASDIDVDIKIKVIQGQVWINHHVIHIPDDGSESVLPEGDSKTKSHSSTVPDYWEIPTDDSIYHAFELKPNSWEYTKVKNAFYQTTSNEIVKIERIQNPGIYELYNVKRKAMKEKYGDGDFPDKEKQLFHGTSKYNVEKINAGGLNRSFAGKHANPFGKGVYFARDASYALRETYSPKDANGLRYVYYARVLVGDYAKGDSTMLVTPSKNIADPNETYDSVVDDTKDPSIFVMFKDYQYYTEYLITFK